MSSYNLDELDMPSFTDLDLTSEGGFELGNNMLALSVIGLKAYYPTEAQPLIEQIAPSCHVARPTVFFLWGGRTCIVSVGEKEGWRIAVKIKGYVDHAEEMPVSVFPTLPEAMEEFFERCEKAVERLRP